MSELLRSIGEKYQIKTTERNQKSYSQAEIKAAKKQVYRTVKQHIKNHYQQFGNENRAVGRQAYRKVLAEIQSTHQNYRCLPIWMSLENFSRIRYLDPNQADFKLSPTVMVLGVDDSFIYLMPDLEKPGNQFETSTRIPRTFLILEEIYSVSDLVQRRLRNG